MDFCQFLSEEKNYRELLGVGNREVFCRSYYLREEAEDIASQALENILDYFQRKPAMLAQLEARQELEMRNYLKKAVRNQVLNILKSRGRQEYVQREIVARAMREEMENSKAVQMEELLSQASESLFSGFLRRFGFYIEDTDHFSIEKLKEELHFFIEEKYGREKWEGKKEIIAVYLERFEKNLSLQELKSHYPEWNIQSMNAEANRMIRRYLRWVRESDRSAVFCKDERGEA